MSRLPGASLISSSFNSSHCSSVRWLSGIDSSSCRRRRGDIGWEGFIPPLSHCSAALADAPVAHWPLAVPYAPWRGKQDDSSSRRPEGGDTQSSNLTLDK